MNNHNAYNFIKPFKKGLSRTIIFLIVSMMGIGNAWADTWDGTTKTAPNMTTNNGSSEALAIQISKAAELAWLGDQIRQGLIANGKTYGGKYWKLTVDINLGGKNDFTGHDWASMIGNTGNAFCGYFDGGGHTISNIQVASATSKKYYGLFPSIQGASTTNLSTVKNLKINGAYFKATTSMGKDTRIGSLTGYAKQANISNLEISNVTFTYTNTITNTNQLGGAIGCMENNTTLNNVDVTGVTATFSNTTTGLYVGGIVGASTGTANTNSMTNCDAKTIKVTHSSNITGTTHMGGLVGNANTSLNVINKNTVSGVIDQGGNEGVGFEVTVDGTATAFNAGGFLGYTTGGAHEIKNNTVSSVSITEKGNTAGTNYLGGFVGYAKGSGSPSTRITIQGNTATNVKVTMNGIVGSAFYMGGFIGYCVDHTNVYNNKLASPIISITNDINAETYIGGAVGRQTNYTTIDGMIVSGGSIGGPTSGNKTIKNNVTFFVGGFIGQQHSSGTTAYQPNIFRNIAVTGMNINLAHYVPATTITNNKFGVGGIAGCINAPNRDANGFCGMPENLIFKGGKIYAPYATTSPTVSNFNASNPGHNTMTTEVISTIDALDKAKTKTWYYSDYKLGLSSDFLNSTFVLEKNAAPESGKYRKNYTATPTVDNGISYITVNNSTFDKQNRYQDSERDSKTVLWWTTTGSAAASFTAEEQPINPYQGSITATSYPYYWYFFQGVANANYASATDADAIIAGIVGNMTEAAKTTYITLAITNDKENERGFDERTISVSATSNETDVTSNYTYKWYLNGKAYTTGTSINLTPHWKDGQGLTVNALSGSMIVATATYTLAPGVLKTKAGTKDKVRSNINGRGTSSNPYIIDCEAALRQLSYLSTRSNTQFIEGMEILYINGNTKTAYHSVYHYNRAYYELGNDIKMSDEPFVPISHVGYGADGTWGTYHANYIFQGVFDGKGHKISDLKITWGAGQYNGNNTNIYYGLFGAVGNTAATATATIKWGESSAANTVIKNLVIDGATLTHDVNNTTFSYQKNYSHITSANANNCMVGVLAGVVGGYTTIHNIEIRNSNITDKGSSDYSLAKLGLYVGGAIGSIQVAFNATANIPTGVQIDHIAAKVDVTLTHPTFVSSPVAAAEVSQFNIGGIASRYIATTSGQAAIQATLPKYTFYSGSINAPKAWVSPVLAAMRYNSQNSINDWKTFSKQWEGNNNSAATQLKIVNAQYYNLRINGQFISDLYPTNICGNNARAIVAHTDAAEDANKYDAKKYQGVNYGARFIDSDGTNLMYLNEGVTDNVYWTWSEGFPHMNLDSQSPKPISAYLNRTDNSLTANLTEGSGSAYRWQISFDGESWTNIADAMSQTFSVNTSSMPKLIVAIVTSGGTEYRTQAELFKPEYNMFTPFIQTTGNASAGYTFEVNWMDGKQPSGTLETTYQWYKSDQTTALRGKTSESLSLSKDELNAVGGYVWCAVTVKEIGITVYKWMLVAGDLTVVYVNGNEYTGTDEFGNAIGTGNDTNNGLTPQTPVKTIDVANSKLKNEANGGTIDNNIIVIMGKLNDDNVLFHSSGTNPATLTGKYNGFDYHGVITIKQKFPDGGEHNLNQIESNKTKGTNCYVLGDTKFENLMFYGMQEENSFIELHGHDAIFGKGLVMQNFKDLSLMHGNMNNSEVIPELTILLYATNLSKAKIDEYTQRIHTRGKPQTVTFQSGHYGRLMAGRFTQNFFPGGSGGYKNNTAYSILGSAEHPVWAVVNVEIDANNEMTDLNGKRYSRDVNAVIAGLTDGSMYGDYTINFHGGNVAYIVGANQGNPVKNGTKTYTPKDGTLGSWGEWPNASFFGRSVINIDQMSGVKAITVGNLYAGGLGRKVQTDNATAIVDMYMYGHTEVNVKNGVISGSVYGGGVGGVLGANPWDAHAPYATDADDLPANAIINKVQYGDTRFSPTWDTTMTTTSPMAKVRLHTLNATGDGYVEESLDLKNTSTTVNISGGTVYGNVYGGGYGFVQDMPVEATMQGVGSVFGTANINITGGTINGNIHGGSQGHTYYYNQQNKYGQTITHIAELNGTVNLNITGTDAQYPKIGGDIYGAGQGINSKADGTQEYLRIATAGNYDLVGQNATEVQKKKYSTDINITIDMPEDIEFHNDIYGGGALGMVDGTTNIVLKHGNFTGNIYGGGYGEKDHLGKAMVNGDITISTGDANPANVDKGLPVMVNNTIYGGGNMAQVTGNTFVNIHHGNITGDVFGGGKGLTASESGTETNYGKVTGNTHVLYNNATENNILTGNIYGGGALGDVKGNTEVKIKDGIIKGNVFGAGKGEEGHPDKAKVSGNTNVIVEDKK